MLCDPNILACPDHMELLHQLEESKARVTFNQGLDIRFVNEKNLDALRRLKLGFVHFAFDRYQDKDLVVPKLRMFKEKTGLGRTHVFVYVLVNFDTTLEQDLYRIYACRDIGFQPFVMIYDKEHCDKVYRKLQRWCSPYIFWKVDRFEDYKNGEN